MQKSTAYREYTKICFHDDERWSSKKSNLPLWSRRGLSSVFWNQQGCKCTQTELGYKCLFMSLGVTWPKTTATQKGKTVPATCQPRPRTWCARKPCGVVYEHGCQGLGRVSCEGRCQGLPVLVPDSSAAASTGITEWLRMEGTSGGGTSGRALHPQRKAGTSSGGHLAQPPCSSRAKY